MSILTRTEVIRRIATMLLCTAFGSTHRAWAFTLWYGVCGGLVRAAEHHAWGREDAQAAYTKVWRRLEKRDCDALMFALSA